MEAVTNNKTRIHALWPSIAVVAGLVFAFIGERIMRANGSVRIACAVIAGAALIAAVAQRLRESGAATDDKKGVARTLLLTTLGVAAAMLLYAAIPVVLDPMEDAGKTARAVIWGLWPVVLLCSVAPLAMVEAAVASVAYIDRYETRRIQRAVERGLGLALLVSCLFFGNYLVSRNDKNWDLSYGQKARISDNTMKTLREVTEPVSVTLFFSRASDVADALEPYFESARSASPHIKVKRIDHALAGDLAKETGVTENGYIAVSHGKSHEKVRIGEKLASARGSMRKFDQNFLGAVLKVTRERKVANFVTGHEERSPNPPATDTRSGIKLLKQLLESNQYVIKNYGLGEGLAAEVPRDGSILFIMGPEKPFSPAEVEAINRAVDQGGARIFIALEGEREGENLDAILKPLGLQFTKTLLANERANIPFTKTSADRLSIYSNRYSSHESVTTMTRNDKLATAFAKTGYLSKVEGASDKIKTEMVLTAVDDTFADLNGNLSFEDPEKKEAYGLAAAVTRTATSGKKADESRIFVTSDADVFTDELIKFEGNVRLLADIVYWLRTVEEPIVPTVSEADVQIVHKKDEDALVFWGTTLGAPLLVLAFGIGVATQKKRRS